VAPEKKEPQNKENEPAMREAALAKAKKIKIEMEKEE